MLWNSSAGRIALLTGAPRGVKGLPPAWSSAAPSVGWLPPPPGGRPPPPPHALPRPAVPGPRGGRPAPPAASSGPCVGAFAVIPQHISRPWRRTSSSSFCRPSFFYDPITQRSRHLIHITLIERQLVGNLLVRYVEPHKIQTQDPHFQRLVMSGKDRVGQIIKTCVTAVTLIALTSGFRVIEATLNDLFGLTRGAGDAIGPASFADRLITLNLIDQILDVDLHRWTPVRGWDMGWHQYTTSSNSTTLESNKSVEGYHKSKRTNWGLQRRRFRV
jgi:hypothetical protein